LYTGNGATQSITVGFQPDFVWYKSRSSGVYNHGLFDSVRGVTKQLFSNTSGAEATYSGVTAFNSSGFSVGSDNGGNESGGSMVAWNWKASNATAVTNTLGTITSNVSANSTSGFSIVTYTGNGASAQTFGHGLGVAPSMVLVKNRDNGTAWQVYNQSLGRNKVIYLNGTNAADTGANYWGTVDPTSTVFGLSGDTSINGSAANIIAYCFAPIAGYSAFGSYTGNGSADGPFVYTGFRPRYVLLKRTNSSGNWFVMDTANNPSNNAGSYLSPNLSDPLYSDGIFDILSNGFKNRNTFPTFNGSGDTFIYAAFAENPFKYSLAR
jgi:hypothetical protein